MLLRQGLEEAAPSGEGFLLRARYVARLAHERTEVRQHPIRVLVDQLFDRAAQLRFHFGVAVGLEDAGLRLDHLRQRPVADPFGVRQRPALAPVRQYAAALDRLEELADEAALADPGDADERHQLRRALPPRTFERSLELLELTVAADERRARLGCEVDSEPRPRLQHLPHRDRLVLALRLDRGALVEVERPPRRAIRPLPDQNPVHGRGRLQARRGVDDVPGCHPLTGLRPRRQVDERLAGRHGDPHLQLPLLDDPVADRKRCANGTLRIVLARHRLSEQRHHRVADELLYRPDPALQLVTQALVVRRQDGLDVLRVEPFRPGSEADQVGEEDRDDLALRPAARLDERGRTLGAELGRGVVLVAAVRADDHARSLRRAKSRIEASSANWRTAPSAPASSMSSTSSGRVRGTTRSSGCSSLTFRT